MGGEPGSPPHLKNSHYCLKTSGAIYSVYNRSLAFEHFKHVG